MLRLVGVKGFDRAHHAAADALCMRPALALHAKVGAAAARRDSGGVPLQRFVPAPACMLASHLEAGRAATTAVLGDTAAARPAHAQGQQRLMRCERARCSRRWRAPLLPQTPVHVWSGPVAVRAIKTLRRRSQPERGRFREALASWQNHNPHRVPGFRDAVQDAWMSCKYCFEFLYVGRRRRFEAFENLPRVQSRSCRAALPCCAAAPVLVHR